MTMLTVWARIGGAALLVFVLGLLTKGVADVGELTGTVNALVSRVDDLQTDMDNRLREMDDRFDRFENRMEQRFAQIDDRFAEVNAVLLDHTDRLARVEAAHGALPHR